MANQQLQRFSGQPEVFYPGPKEIPLTTDPIQLLNERMQIFEQELLEIRATLETLIAKVTTQDDV